MHTYLVERFVSGTNYFFCLARWISTYSPLNGFLVAMSLIVFHFCIISPVSAAGLGGTVYVPNLHAKCLSSHQKCLLEQCSSMPDAVDNGVATAAGIECAQMCIQEYEVCEDTVQRLRVLDSAVPIVPKHHEASKLAELRRLVRQEQGYVD